MDMKDNSSLVDRLRSARKQYGDQTAGWGEGPTEGTAHTHFSNDFVDGIAAVAIILILVSGVVYWLQSMP